MTVLWCLTAVSLLAAATLVTARNGIETTRNRLLLARAGWAREACAEILVGRYAERSGDPATAAGVERTVPVSDIDSIDLGRGTWCRVRMDDPSARLHLNLASSEALRTVIGSDSLVDALLDWRDEDDIPRPHGAEAAWYAAARRPAPRNGPLADVRELSLVRGFDQAAVTRLESLLTTRGAGQINLNAAPLSVVATLPGISDDALAVLARRRELGRALGSVHGLLADLTPPARQALLASYREFAQQAVYAPAHWVAVIEGRVVGSEIRARMTLTVAPAGDRLAVVRREVEP